MQVREEDPIRVQSQNTTGVLFLKPLLDLGCDSIVRWKSPMSGDTSSVPQTRDSPRRPIRGCMVG